MVEGIVIGKQNPSKSPRAGQQLRVASQVIFQLGQERMKGVITEDRGTIGAGGRRLYRIEAPFGPDEPPLVGEFSVEALQPA